MGRGRNSNNTAKGDSVMAKKSSSGSGSGKARSAETGHYVKKSYAKEHPKTTVVERDKAKPKEKK